MTKETYLYNKELHDIHIGRSKWSTAELEELGAHRFAPKSRLENMCSAWRLQV